MSRGRRTLLTATIATLGAVVLVAAWRTSQPISQQSGNVLVVTSPFTLREHRESLVVFGQSTITLDQDSRVDGDVALIALNGAPIVVDGTIGGDLTVIGSDVTLGEQGDVRGETTLVGSQIEVLGRVGSDLVIDGSSLRFGEAASVTGTLEVCGIEQGSIQDLRADFTAYMPCSDSRSHWEIPRLAVAGVGSLLLTGIAALIVTIFPRQISQMEEALRRSPRRAGSVGLGVLALALGVTTAVVIALALVPGLGIILTPIYIVAALVLGCAALAGGVTLAMMIGDWVLRKFGMRTPPVVTALVGMLTLVIPLNILSVLPIVDGVALLIVVVLAALGLGAALDTRLGTRDHGRHYFVQG